MRKLLVSFIFLLALMSSSLSAGEPWHDVVATVYNPTEEQCDSDPLTTASGCKINLDRLKNGKLRWVAVSRDLLDKFPYGSYIYVWIDWNHPFNGVWRVTDCMNERYTNRIDFLTYNRRYGKWNAKIQKNV